MADFLTEINGKLEAKASELATLLDKKDAATGDYAWEAADVDRFRELERDCKDLQGKRASHLERQRAAESVEGIRADLKRVERPFQGAGFDGADVLARMGHGAGQANPFDAFVKSVVEDAHFKANYRPGHSYAIKLPDFDVRSILGESKTVMTTAAGFAPPNIRGPVQVAYAIRRPMVGDLIPQDPVGPMNGVRYMEETTWTNNAAAVAEGASKPESAFAWTERAVTIEVIATTIPVTEQQLEDIPQIEAILRNRMGTQIALKEEDYLLNGTGTSPQIQGIMTKSGVLTQAAASDPTPDVILKAMTQVMNVGFANPTGVVLNPTNYQNMRLLQSTTGEYIFGSPAGQANVTIWGMEPVVTTAMTSGSGLVGDFRDYAHISRRKGLTIDLGWVNDDFRRNQKTIRAEERLALEIFRPAAFAILSGLA